MSASLLKLAQLKRTAAGKPTLRAAMRVFSHMSFTTCAGSQPSIATETRAERTLDVHINRLRDRFPEAQHGFRIKTLRGLGYRLEVTE